MAGTSLNLHGTKEVGLIGVSLEMSWKRNLMELLCNQRGYCRYFSLGSGNIGKNRMLLKSKGVEFASDLGSAVEVSASSEVGRDEYRYLEGYSGIRYLPLACL